MAAIYQWLINEQVLTTTIYPIEGVEYLSITVAVDVMDLRPVPSDMFAMGHAFVGASTNTVRIEFTEGPDEFTVSHSFVGASRKEVRIEFTEGPDTFSLAHSFVGASRKNQLVTTYSPDHSLDLVITLDTENSSMEFV